jgi:hypothetical protein
VNPFGAALGEHIRPDMQMQASGGNIKRDHVAGVDKGERTAGGGLCRDMSSTAPRPAPGHRKPDLTQTVIRLDIADR